MKIYVGHSTGFGYKKELYEPLRNSALNERVEFVLPHERNDAPYQSKEVLKTVDVFLAEVSLPSTGLGIELGWADDLGVPIIAVYKKGQSISRSITGVAQQVIEYTSADDLISRLVAVIPWKS